MPTTTVREEVNIALQTITYIVTTLFQVLFRVAYMRGLSPVYIQRNHEVIENGLTTWITEQKLRKLTLQVFRAGSSNALENWSVAFTYTADPSAELRRPAIEQLEDFASQLRSLPPGCEYRIHAEVDQDASTVEGWQPGTKLPIIGRTRKDVFSWGHERLDAALEYEGGEWDNSPTHT
jgi:hypothetical protein